MKAQGSIELMIIAPVMIFFIYVLYLNGVRLHAVLTAANTNYSDGIAIIRPAILHVEVCHGIDNLILQIVENTFHCSIKNKNQVDLLIPAGHWKI